MTMLLASILGYARFDVSIRLWIFHFDSLLKLSESFAVGGKEQGSHGQEENTLKDRDEKAYKTQYNE